MRTTRVLSAATALVAGILTVAAVPTQAASSSTIYVPDDFNPTLSDTRSTGRYEVAGSALHVWTTPNTAPTGPSTNKVAEYVDTNTPLAAVGSPKLNQTYNSGSTVAPGFQLQVDKDRNGTIDGILVGEPSAPGYGDNWWLSNGADAAFKAGAPHVGGGFGSLYYGTLAEWSAAFPNADVKAFGFSLGSGVTGEWTINSIDFAGTNYTFGKHVTLTSKNDCKDGGWMSSTKPVFKNQGDCVSSFARG